MKLLFEKVTGLMEHYGADAINFRDFDNCDEELTSFFAEQGYFKISMPENNTIEDLSWQNEEDFINLFSSRTRRHLRQEVIKHSPKFFVEVADNLSPDKIAEYHNLYLNVKNKSFELNTFPLPIRVFENIASNKNWELIILKLKPEFDYTLEQKPVAAVWCFRGNGNYIPVLVGLDYNCPREHNAYRQAIYQVVLRAKALNMKKVRLGYSASIEKRKFGAKTVIPSAFIQLRDNYNLEALGMISAQKKVNS